MIRNNSKNVMMIYLMALSLLFSSPMINFDSVEELGTFIFNEGDEGITGFSPFDLEDAGIISGDGVLDLFICDQVGCSLDEIIYTFDFPGIDEGVGCGVDGAGVCLEYGLKVKNNPTTNKLEVYFDQNYYGDVEIPFLLTDDSGEEVRDTLLISVLPIDDIPVIRGDISIFLTEGVSTIIDFLAPPGNADNQNPYDCSFSEYDGDFVEWSIDGEYDLNMNFISPGFLEIAVPEGWNSTNTIIIRAKDLTVDGLYSEAQFTFSLRVPPHFTQDDPYVIEMIEDVPDTIHYLDDDIYGDFFTDLLSSVDEIGTLELSSNFEIKHKKYAEDDAETVFEDETKIYSYFTITPVRDWSGSDEVQFDIRTGGETVDVATFNIIVEPYDDLPLFDGDLSTYGIPGLLDTDLVDKIPVQVLNIIDSDVDGEVDPSFNTFDLKPYILEVDSAEVEISWDLGDSPLLTEFSFNFDETGANSWIGYIYEEPVLKINAKPAESLVAGTFTDVTFTIKDVGSADSYSTDIRFRVNNNPIIEWVSDGDGLNFDGLAFDEDISILNQVIHDTLYTPGGTAPAYSEDLSLINFLKLPWADTLIVQDTIFRYVLPSYGRELIFSNFDDPADPSDDEGPTDGGYNFTVTDLDNDIAFPIQNASNYPDSIAVDFSDSLTIKFSSNGNIEFFPDSLVFYKENFKDTLWVRNRRDWFGNDTLKIEIEDNFSGKSLQNLIFSVNNVNDAPWFTGKPYDAQEGQHYSSKLEIIDKEGDDLTVTATSIPNWLSFDSANLTLSGNPPEESTETQYYYSIKVNDGALDGIIQDFIRLYPPFQPPITPELFAYVEDEKVILSWDKESEKSIDPVFGHYDFEGYRLYRSLDRGKTWCAGEDIIRDDAGDSIACTPYQQFDLDRKGDLDWMIYGGSVDTTKLREVVGPDSIFVTRNTDISGFDPYLSRVNLGSNTGLQYSFVDEDVYDGVEYTYTLTAYDTGFRDIINYNYNDTLSDGTFINGDGSFVRDTVWSKLNPGKAILNGTGFKSLEASLGSSNGPDMNIDNWDINYITIVPGKSASNITYPDTAYIDTFMVPGEGNIGNGDVLFAIVDENDLPHPDSTKILRFEVKANYDEDAAMPVDPFAGYKTNEPKLFVYEVAAPNTKLAVDKEEWLKSDFLEEGELDSVRLLPGVSENEDALFIPEYILKDHSMSYLDDYGYRNNWTGIFNGVRFRFDNSLREFPLDGNAKLKLITKLSLEGEINLDIDEVDTMLVNPDGSMKGMELKFGYYDSDVFTQRPPYEYRIEFTGQSYPASTTCSALQATCPEEYESSCPVGGAYLPFKIKNLITGRYVDLIYYDKGTDMDASSEFGFQNCYWERGEDIIIREMVTTRDIKTDPGDFMTALDCENACSDFCSFELNESDTTFYCPKSHEALTFKLSLDWDLGQSFALLSGDWNTANLPYSEGEFVFHEGMVFEATVDIYESIPPNTYTDEGNPWKVQYPWEEGHYIDIKPLRWFVNGDYWTVDLGEVGKVNEVDEASFEEVNVVPNPYYVHSEFETDPNISKLRFIHLPDECIIKIYTVTGEFVDEIKHNNVNNNGTINSNNDGTVNSGSEWWDLKNQSGNEIAPGLYIYVVESSGYEHIGKFAVVR
jgi:hypothetical protein